MLILETRLMLSKAKLNIKWLLNTIACDTKAFDPMNIPV